MILWFYKNKQTKQQQTYVEKVAKEFSASQIVPEVLLYLSQLLPV